MDVGKHAFVSAALVAVLVAGLSACGGGGGGDTDSGPPSLWQGTYTPIPTEPPVRLVGVVRHDGTAFFYDQDGILFAMPKITPAKSVTGDAIAYPPYGFIFVGGAPTIQYEVTATITDTALLGRFLIQGSTGIFKLAAFQPFDGAPSVVPGAWSGGFIGGGGIAFQVGPGGSISGFDGLGCSLTGSVDLIEPGQNLFDVSIQLSGSSSQCDQHLNGLAYESSRDDLGMFGHAAGTYYYITASDSRTGFLAELKVQ